MKDLESQNLVAYRTLIILTNIVEERGSKHSGTEYSRQLVCSVAILNQKLCFNGFDPCSSTAVAFSIAVSPICLLCSHPLKLLPKIRDL